MCADIRPNVDQTLAGRFFTACLQEGVYFHTDFTVSMAHTDEVLEDLVARVTRAAERVAGQAQSVPATTQT